MHIFDVCYACSGIAAGCQPLFAASFSVVDRGAGKIYNAVADLSGKQPYRTKVFLYQSYIYH